MNWIDYVWPMVAGICLTLGLVHLGSGLRGASRRVNLLFALIAFLMVVYTVIEWRLMHANSPPQYLAWLRLLDFAGSAVAMMLAIFTRVYFAAGRKWLLLLGIVVTSMSLILDLLPTPQLVFRELTRVTQVPTFGAATYAFAEGVRNPWNAVFYLGLALLMVFVGHVTWIQCKRGDFRRAVLIGGTIVTTFVLASVHASLVDIGIMKTPYMLSVTWLFVLVAMASELSNDQVRAARLSKDLRESQQRLQLATSAADLGVWDWDVVRDTIHVAAPVQARLGLKESEPLNFSRYLESVHPEDRPRFEQTVRRALERDTEFEAEYRVITPDGEPRWISARGRVERGLSGKPIHLLGVSMDITGRKSAEIEAAQLRRDLAHAARATTLNELSVSLAHELNQPLGIILSNAQAAQDLIAGNPQVPGEVGEILSDIVAADRRAAAVIQQMRAMLKRDELSLMRLCLNTLLNPGEDVIGIFGVRARLAF